MSRVGQTLEHEKESAAALRGDVMKLWRGVCEEARREETEPRGYGGEEGRR